MRSPLRTIGAVAFIFCVMLGSAFGSHIVSESARRSAWAPRLNDEEHGIIFFPTGGEDDTLAFTTVNQNCDSAHADMDANPKFLDELVARGFVAVNCMYVTEGGNIREDVTWKFGRVAPKPLPRPNPRDRRSWTEKQA